MGAMPWLALACLVGVATSSFHQYKSGHRLSDQFLLPFRLIIAGFLGVTVYTVALGWAVGAAPNSDKAQVMLMNYLWPVWMVLLAVLLLPQKPRIGLALTGAFIGFCGVVFARGFDGLRQPPSTLIPHIVALASAFFWSLYCVLLKRWSVPDEKSGTSLQFLLCGVAAAIIAAFNGEWEAFAGLVRQWPGDWHAAVSPVFWIVFAGVGPIGTAYYFWEIGMKRGSTHLLAVLSNFIPVASAILIGLLFHESMTWRLIPAAMLIALAAYIGRRATVRMG